MGDTVRLVVPEAPAPAASAGFGQRAIAPGSVRLGVLDNGKGNADHLLRFVTEGIRAALPVNSILSLRKASVSLPAPAEILDRFAEESDFVVTAMAD